MAADIAQVAAAATGPGTEADIAPAAAGIGAAVTAVATEVAEGIAAAATEAAVAIADRPDRDRSRQTSFLSVARQAAGL